MSVEALAAVLHHSRSKGTAKLVLLGIANHDGDGGAWPTVATLARYANVNERTIQRSLETLVGLGEITVRVQAGGTTSLPDFQRPNLYRVLVACPPWCDRTTAHRDTRPGSAGTRPLWTEGVTPVSPGDASVTGGVTPVSPGGVTPVSPKPSLEPDTNSVRDSTTDRARELGTAPCRDCGQAELRCQIAQAKWPLSDRHVYAPR